MATLPQSVADPVADAIYSHYEAVYGYEPARPYLGASSIGKSCQRELWYSLRWAKKAQFSGRLYRLFQSGHLQEPRVVSDLTGIGCVVQEIDPSTGKQWSFKEPTTGNHLAGNLDGLVHGVPGATKTKHVLEIKTSSDKLFKVMQKDGVLKSKPQHFFQMQIYMHWSKCTRAIYIVVNKDNDEIYTERVEYDKEVAQALINKANAIIDSPVPPERINNDQTWFECKFCDYSDICHGQEVPQVTCRSCANSTPTKTGDAEWTCAKYESEIPVDAQREGCNGHIYIPILLERFATPIDASGDGVVYQMKDGSKFVNGDPEDDSANISSAEIFHVKDKTVLTNPEVVNIRLHFNPV